MIINSDVTEQIIFKVGNRGVTFLFYSKYIPVKDSKNSSNVVFLVKEVLSFIKQNNANSLIDLPDWLYK